MLLEKGKLLSKQKDVASTFSKHLGSITDLINLFSWSEDIWFAPKYKALKKKKLKREFSFSLLSKESV